MSNPRKMSFRLCALAAVLLLLGTVVFGMPAPARADGEAAESGIAESILGGGPTIGAKSAIVMEVGSGAVLYAKDAASPHVPMSLTKLMTALLAFENLTMNDSVSFSYRSIHSIGSKVTRIGLVENERLSVLDALYGMLVASSDEAAYALGEKMGNGRISNFIAMMNERMKALGGINTTFDSATGTGGTKQTSCAYDLGLIACEVMRFPTFARMAGSKWYEIPATNLKEKRMLAQTHQFIRQTKTYQYAVAGKSGGVSASGEYSLCTYAERDGMRVVAIVLDASGNDRAYDDTVTILNYAFENYKVHSMRSIESTVNDNYTGLFDECPMFDDGSGELIYIDRNSSVVLPHGADPSTLTKSIRYEIPSEYVHGENVIGHAIYLYQGRRVGNAAIVFNNPEYPMSQKEFEEVWPYFLIPPNMLVSQGGSGVVIDNSYLTANLTPAPTPDPSLPTPTLIPPSPVPDSSLVITAPEEPEKGFLGSLSVRTKALLLGGGIFLVTFVPCIILIFVVLPRRARRRNRYTKRL
ncbi:MAG: hypothetical protein K6B39_00820 [Lachnospiraceae bacterium]|nr:hypothetical protein [Lachnospiraceae bacterium]